MLCPFTTWIDRRARTGLIPHNEKATPIERRIGPAGAVFREKDGLP
jgi:hypothetical protein